MLRARSTGCRWRRPATAPSPAASPRRGGSRRDLRRRMPAPNSPTCDSAQPRRTTAHLHGRGVDRSRSRPRKRPEKRDHAERADGNAAEPRSQALPAPRLLVRAEPEAEPRESEPESGIRRHRKKRREERLRERDVEFPAEEECSANQREERTSPERDAARYRPGTGLARSRPRRSRRFAPLRRDVLRRCLNTLPPM
jgi:hypothetical protein